MEKSVRAGLGALVQTNSKLDKPLTVLPNSTLNQKFSIYADQLPGTDDRVFTDYAVIGIGGHRTELGVNNLVKINTIQHQPRHTALYSHIPFVMRLVSNDLSAAERLRYRLRRIETHNGLQYACYYARVLDLSTTVPRLEYRTVVDGVVTSTPWEPTVGDLSPTPPAVSSGQVITTGNDYIAASGRTPFVLSAADVQEILSAVNIIYGDPGYAIISEMALCSGMDKQLTGDFNGTAVAYTEAIAVQVNDFLATMVPLTFMTNGTTIDLDVGSVEPLLQLS